MARVAPRVPELSEILCSSCGYVLDGLDHQSRCPECGKPIADSIGSDRTAPSWDLADPEHHRFTAFIQTSWEVIRRPALFYRTFTVRGSLDHARAFARLHWWLAAALFGLAGTTHAVWFSYHVAPIWQDIPWGVGPWGVFAVLFPVLTLLTYLSLDFLTRLASWLTNLEATYRGLRLPYAIVLRGLYYHAAHYFPVAVLTAGFIEGYQLLLLLPPRWLPFDLPMDYLYGLCALVVLSAIYLFKTYWTGMKNMMYANR